MLALIIRRKKGKKKCASCYGANKGMHHIVKMISFWYEHRVITFLLDADALVDTNISTAESICSSLTKVDGTYSNGHIVKEK